MTWIWKINPWVDDLQKIVHNIRVTDYRMVIFNCMAGFASHAKDQVTEDALLQVGFGTWRQDDVTCDASWSKTFRKKKKKKTSNWHLGVLLLSFGTSSRNHSFKWIDFPRAFWTFHLLTFVNETQYLGAPAPHARRHGVGGWAEVRLLRVNWPSIPPGVPPT